MRRKSLIGQMGLSWLKAHYKMHMDIEWAKDGETNEIFIVQARPETFTAKWKKSQFKEYKNQG